jgi:hypothetical protein
MDVCFNAKPHPSCRSLPLALILGEQLLAPDRGDHAAAAARLAGLGWNGRRLATVPLPSQIGQLWHSL